MEAKLTKSQQTARAHGLFALFVLLALSSWWFVLRPSTHTALPTHPRFPGFAVMQTDAGIEVAELDWRHHKTDLGERVVFFERGPELRLPFRVWDRKQWVSDAVPSLLFTKDITEGAIAAFVAANPDCDWSRRGLGAPPTFANSPDVGAMASMARGRIEVAGLMGCLALWGVVAMAVRSAYKWFTRPRVSMGAECVNCGYDLSAVTGAVCPECGCARAIIEAVKGGSS